VGLPADGKIRAAREAAHAGRNAPAEWQLQAEGPIDCLCPLAAQFGIPPERCNSGGQDYRECLKAAVICRDMRE
jgi:hypothetical protein